MKRLQLPSVLGASLLAVATSQAAITFVNPGLDGTAGYGNAPTGWSGVPYTTSWTTATDADGAAPLVMNTTPFGAAVFYGTPHSGETFAGGMNLGATQTSGFKVYQQGLQQTVSNFTVGEQYSFSFFQAVVKGASTQDDTGTWKVFMDGELLTITLPSTGTQAYDDSPKPLNWEQRTVTFTATAETHNFGFLAYDPDEDITNVAGDSTHGLLMGIDTFSDITPVPEPSAAALGIFGAMGLLRRRRA